MKKRPLLLYAILLLLCVVSCNRTSYQHPELNKEISEIIRSAAAQHANNPDSLLSILNTLLDENRNRLTAATMAVIYQRKGNIYNAKREFDVAHSTLSQALRLAKKTDNISRKIGIKINIGVNHSQRGNIQAGIDYFRQALLILHNYEDAITENLSHLGWVYTNLAASYQAIGKTEYARHYIQSTIDIARQRGCSGNEANALFNLAMLLYMYGEYEQTEQTYRRVLELAEKLNDKVFLSQTFHNLAHTVFTMNRVDEAFYYMERSKEMALASGVRSTDFARAGLYYMRRRVYLERNEYINALKVSDNLLEIQRRLEATIHIAHSYHFISQVYARTGNYAKTLHYANKALEFAKREGVLDLLTELYEIIAYAHAKLGNTEQFSYAIAASRLYRDSVFTAERFAAIQEIQTRFQTEQKQQEIIQQRKENQAQRATIIYLTIICALIVLLLIALYIFHRKKLQQHIQIIQQHEALSHYVRKGHQPFTKNTDESTDTEPDDLAKQRLAALHHLFESEKIYRNAGLNINDVAKRLGSNQAYLSKDINLYHQKNFNEYVNYYRIEEAKEILRAQNEGQYANLTNEGIAEMVGFGSPAVFYKTFKQVVGITSLEYKKAVRQMK